MKPQVNLRLPEKLRKAAEKYVRRHSYRNLQEFATEAIREKLIRKDYDESFTPKEIELIDHLITATVKKGEFISKKQLFKDLE